MSLEPTVNPAIDKDGQVTLANIAVNEQQQYED